jgi:hypothetical protein
MYAVLLFNQYTGEVVEIHSGFVGAEFSGAFSNLPDDACFEGFALSLPLSYMNKNYKQRAYSIGPNDYTSASLPWVLPWKVRPRPAVRAGWLLRELASTAKVSAC